ncbi:hypothetical protein [Clostridium sp. AN503]|uniref:hypothetical protein n=1 Tax=Clostridium sp. AN503 TaxID=3160598 RepID=UPI003458BF07
MWTYTKCTASDRAEKIRDLSNAFQDEKECLKYLAKVQNEINSVSVTVVLLQDLDANVLLEMDYVPVNDYIFNIGSIADNGIKVQGIPCKTIMQAVSQLEHYYTRK